MQKALNGKLIDYNFSTLMEKVKERGCSLYTELEHEDKIYNFSIHCEELITKITDETKWYIDVIETDSEGKQTRICKYEKYSNLSETEVVEALEEIKKQIISQTKKRGRKKIRNYPSTEQVADEIYHYFYENKEIILAKMAHNFGFKDFNDLKYHEYHDNNGYGYFGLDCGWVYVKTRNAEQHREWVLDNGKYDAHVWVKGWPYNSQSTTLKEYQLNLALKDLGLDQQYYAFRRLD